MPRKRRSRKKKNQKEIAEVKVNKVKKVEKTPKPVKLTPEEIKFAHLEALSYEQVISFTKTHEQVVVVVYEVPTSRLTSTDQIENWKLGLVAALQKAAKGRRLQISRDRFKFEALPKGEMTLIKGYFRMRDVHGGAGAEQHKRQSPPAGKEGMIIE